MSWAAAAAAAATAISGVAQGVATGKLNKKNRAWQEDMWNKTNEYNSPQQQMARFKAAGLNPHLIYGQGNSGNATMAGAPKTEAPNFNKFADAAQGYVTNKLQKEQLSLQTRVAEAEIQNKQAQTSNTQAQEESTRQDIAQKAITNPIGVQAATLGNQRAEADIMRVNSEIDKIANDMKNSSALTEAQVAKINTEIPKLKQDMQATAMDIRLKAIDGDTKGINNAILKIQKQMWDAGINPNSGAVDQLIKAFLNAAGVGNKSGIGNEGNSIKKGADWMKKQYDIMGGIKGWFTR